MLLTAICQLAVLEGPQLQNKCSLCFGTLIFGVRMGQTLACSAGVTAIDLVVFVFTGVPCFLCKASWGFQHVKVFVRAPQNLPHLLFTSCST